jgi:hypothetical protein
MAHQLIDEQRMTVGALGQHLGARAGRPLARSAQQLRRQVASVGVGQAIDEHAEEIVAELLAELGEADRIVGGRPHGRAHENRRSAGRPQEIRQQRQAVGLGPVQIFDGDHDRALPPQVAEQLANGGERVETILERRARPPVLEAVRLLEHRLDLAQRREHAGRRRDPLGQQRLDLGARPRRQVAPARPSPRRRPCTGSTRARSSGPTE